MGKKDPKKMSARPKRILRLPDWDHSKIAVLSTLGSPDSQRSYRFAIDDFIAWYCSEPRLERFHLLCSVSGTKKRSLCSLRRKWTGKPFSLHAAVVRRSGERGRAGFV